MDNVSNTIGSSIPLPNGAANPAKGGGVYTGLFPVPATENEYLGKYDQNLGTKDHVAATYFYSKYVVGNSPGGNIPWTINNNVSASTNTQPERRSLLQPHHSQSDLAHVHASGGRTRQPAGNRPGVADPDIVWLELSPPGTALVAHHLRNQFLGDRDQCGSLHGLRQL